MAKKGFFFILNIIKHYFKSYFDRKQIKKIIAFFCQKASVNPFGKCDFWDFERLNFLGPKNLKTTLWSAFGRNIPRNNVR